MSSCRATNAKYEPCAEARLWLGDRADLPRVWEECKRGDWMMWLLGRAHEDGKIDRRTLVLASCAAARTALRYVPDGEERPRIAIETAERWARGEASIDEVRVAARAADAAAADAADAAAAAAADAARAAAYAEIATAIRSVVSGKDIERALAPREG